MFPPFSGWTPTTTFLSCRIPLLISARPTRLVATMPVSSSSTIFPTVTALLLPPTESTPSTRMVPTSTRPTSPRSRASSRTTLTPRSSLLLSLIPLLTWSPT
ncbi:hypothetical protein LB505_012240 [Fusarium chuoi]|nr:hypothetical protein LB505_012240 [Fusarium chuoi]